MPALSHTNLPTDAKIQIRTLTHRFPHEVWIEAVDSKGELYHRDVSRNLLGIKAEICVEPMSGKQVLRVTNSMAEKGFGPLAYDLMMELASSNDFIGLITGTGLTPDSTKIWKHYVEHRKDVIRISVPVSLQGKTDKSFPYLWQKKVTILPQLEVAGKIERIEGDADILGSIEIGTPEEDEQLQQLLDDLDEAQ